MNIFSIGIIAFVCCIIYVAITRYRLNQSKKNIIKRLTYGFESPTEEQPDIDLTAADYGLNGKRLFFFKVKYFLSSNTGKSLVFFLSGTTAGIYFYFLKKTFLSVTFGSIGVGGLALLILLFMLYKSAKNIEHQVQSELPNVLELTSALMEGGIAFESALEFVIKEANPHHPLYFDLRVVSEAMKKGRRRSEALSLWKERCAVIYVGDLVNSLIQAEITGSSIASVLKHHAQAILRENEAVIQRRAERLPVRMLMPMASLILPAVIMIAAGPSIVKILQIITDIMTK
jgi:tight adherence protein C